MKRILFAALLLVLPLMGQAQKALFDKYGDLDEVQTVYITKAMLENSSSLFVSDVTLGHVAKRLNSLQIISTKDEKVREDLCNDFRSIVKSDRYELMMKQKNGAASATEVYTLRDGENIKELITFIYKTPQVKIIYFDGNMSNKDIQEIMMMNF